MDSGVRLYIERAENEARLASAIFILSGSNELKEKTGGTSRKTSKQRKCKLPFCRGYSLPPNCRKPTANFHYLYKEIKP